MKNAQIEWYRRPQKHDYFAARTYLKLTFKSRVAKSYSKKLKRVEMSIFAAKDIFRASRPPLLRASNSHVKKDRAKIAGGYKLSPLLLVRGIKGNNLIIADGHHRLCAVYSFDEDAMIPCKII